MQKQSANFPFVPSPFFAFSLHNKIQNLMEPILLSMLPRKIGIHCWRRSWFQCVHNRLRMLCALSEVRCQKGPMVGKVVAFDVVRWLVLGGAKPKLLIGWMVIVCCQIFVSQRLVSNLPVKFLQVDLQGPFFWSLGCEISPKNKMIIIILYHLKKCLKFELFLFLFVVREQKLMMENKQYFNFQHEILGNQLIN